MLSAMRSIDNRTSENASFGGILIIGIPQPVPFTKKRGVINNCNDGQLWGERLGLGLGLGLGWELSFTEERSLSSTTQDTHHPIKKPFREQL